MSRGEVAVFTNMCMVTDGKGQVLVQDRVDPNWPGLTYPGGKILPGESFAKSVIREVKEETGLNIKDPILCGIKQFQTEHNERYVVLLYKATKYTGTLRSSSEGEVFWIKRDELENHTLVNDFKSMLQVFEDESLSECYYQTKDDSWTVELL